MLQIIKAMFRTPLEAAVAQLIGKGIIKKDQDIVEALSISKGTFISYKNGNARPSRNFIQKFENKYKISLADFEGEAMAGEPAGLYSNHREGRRSEDQEIIDLLKDKIRLLELHNANSRKSQENQAKLFAYLKAVNMHLVKLRAKLEGRKEDVFFVETNNTIAQVLQEEISGGKILDGDSRSKTAKP